VKIDAEAETVVPNQYITICVKGIKPDFFGILGDKHALCAVVDRAACDVDAGEAAAVVDVVVIIADATDLKKREIMED